MSPKTTTKSKETKTSTRPATNTSDAALQEAQLLNRALGAKYNSLRSLSTSLVAEVDNLMTSKLSIEETTGHLGNIVANFAEQLSLYDDFLEENLSLSED